MIASFEICKGFTGPKTFRGFRETVPWATFCCARWALSLRHLYTPLAFLTNTVLNSTAIQSQFLFQKTDAFLFQKIFSSSRVMTVIAQCPVRQFLTYPACPMVHFPAKTSLMTGHENIFQTLREESTPWLMRYMKTTGESQVNVPCCALLISNPQIHVP